ncbi:hypothetical protein FACS189472_04340 [Alphaproteobacteria bacterium]|nr:hypothetical protein FACS189472_04340 [Alphaproteobacteria bacterium]
MYPKIYPKRLHLELTSCCNYRCLMCAHGYNSFGKSISSVVKSTIINELIPHATQMELQGTGESLLYDGLGDIIEAGEKYNCEMIIITNASLLDRGKMLMLTNAGCQIVISMDSPIKSTYEKIRINGDFDKVCNNLDYWKYLKNSMMEDHRAYFSINMVLCSLNYMQLIEMIDFSIDNCAEYLFVSEVRPCVLDEISWSKLTLEKIKETEEFKKMINDAQRYAEQKQFKIIFNFITDIKKEHLRNICLSPWEHVFIFASGDVSVCCEVPQIFGNLNENDFDSIWNGVKLNKFRVSMAVGEYNNKCKACCLQWGITHG